MIPQGFLLIAIMLVVTGSILTSTLVTTRAALHQAIASQARTAMSKATVDFVTWARERVRAENAQTSWAPKMLPTGQSDSAEFKALCSPAQLAGAIVAPACRHRMYAKWVVTGSTTAPVQGGGTAPGIATNMARTVDEQRIAAVVSVAIESDDGRQTFGSASREITARIFDASPWVVVTGVRDLAATNGSVFSGEGDTGGVAGDDNLRGGFSNTPDPNNPSNLVDTRILSDVHCLNSPLVVQNDPRSRTETTIQEMNRQGDMDWSYELLCSPTYPTPAPTGINLTEYVNPSNGTYAALEGDQTTRWSPQNKAQVLFPR